MTHFIFVHVYFWFFIELSKFKLHHLDLNLLVAGFKIGSNGIYVVNNAALGFLNQCMHWHSCAVHR
jgi:hypothetical protein